MPELISGLQAGTLPCINGSRYFLFEPPHHVSPPGMLDLIHSALSSGYVPIITHPERLTYIEGEYHTFVQAANMGAWLQLTAGSLTGTWGPRVKAITERFLRDGVTHIIATDAHNLKNRAPRLSTVKEQLQALVGVDETEQLLRIRPGQVIHNAAVSEVLQPNPQPLIATKASNKTHWFSGLFKRS